MATHPFDFDRYIVPNYGLRLVKNTLYGKILMFTNLGNFSDISGLSSLLDTEQSRMDSNSQEAIAVTASTSISPFATGLYEGFLYKPASNNYARVVLYHAVSSRIVTGVKDAGNWSFDSLVMNSNLRPINKLLCTAYGINFRLRSYGNVHMLDIQGNANQSLDSNVAYNCNMSAESKAALSATGWPNYMQSRNFDTSAIIKVYNDGTNFYIAAIEGIASGVAVRAFLTWVQA